MAKNANTPTAKPKPANTERTFTPWVKHSEMTERDKQMESQGWSKARRQVKERLGLAKPKSKDK